ncbi:hypothetical protein QFC22_005830 [Naganishia vaughanmartiniae]|uniref:Uncharacterized protein n=1 Tax=Naganishia vaughanmartiniae TaxID=1424756 RepID=A0ACC2WQF6_9TREE|nr:hypothetical protein QFC22_005830 [Naganishia vaughanmartiniae]
MYTSTGEAYTQKPVERPAPPVGNEQIEETTVVKEDSQQQQPPLSSQPQQRPSTDLAEDFSNLSVQEPPQTQPALQPTPNNDSTNPVDPFGEWILKEITWPDPRIGGYRRTVKILTQNANGPCSLLALANVLILRGSIHIPPQQAGKITYGALATLIADFLVTRPPPPPQEPNNDGGLTLEAALNILPTTVRGLNVNVGFDEITSFQATEEGSSDELALFAMAGVELVHGWIADKAAGEEWAALQRVSQGAAGGEEKKVPTYDGVQEAIIKGLDGQGQNSSDAATLQQFLQSTATQLTFPGLFALNALEPGSVVAFFRNSHLSVLYRRHNPPVTATDSMQPAAEQEPSSPTLFQLVTDQSFAAEPEITWESIVDIDGAGTTYYNSEFYPAGGAGGDYSGMSAGEVVRRDERARREQEREEARLRGDDGVGYDAGYRGSMEDHTDLQLARALQEEEDRAIAEQYRDQEERQHRRQRTQLDPAVRARAAPRPEVEGEEGEVGSSAAGAGGREGKVKKEKKGKKDCVVM